MTGSDQKSRLAAILAADAAGYSRLMAGDERATVVALDAARAVFRRHIEAHQGRVIDMAGDSVLAVFDTAAGAAAAALAVQRELEAASQDVDEDSRMLFRIGLHLGDVIEKADGSVYGNGVNIAARLQALAEPGGIRVSQIVHETVKGTVPMLATFTRLEQVKNIPDPIPVWKVALSSPSASKPETPASVARAHARRWIAAVLVMVVVMGVAGAWLAMRRAPAQEQVMGVAQSPATDPKSIAILPFDDLSEARNMAHFADGMHEDLLMQLALVGDLKVVSRTSVMDYRGTRKNIRQIGAELGVGTLVEGSVRRSGDRVRVSAQLIDAQSDKHLWARSYDRDLKDIFAIQSELATEIAHALKASLTPRVHAQMERRPTENLEAYELFLRYRELESRGDAAGSFVGDLAGRIDLLTRAVTLDPEFALAWARLAAEESRVRFYLGEQGGGQLARMQDAMDRALALSADDLEVRFQLGYVYYYGYRDYERAARYAEELLQVSPNHVEGLMLLSFLRRRQGRWADSHALMRKVLAIDPRNGSMTRSLAQDLSMFRHDEEAMTLLRRLRDLDPGNLIVTANLRFYESVRSRSFAGYDAWRRTLGAAEAKVDFIMITDVVRALGERDLEAALRLLRDFPEKATLSINWRTHLVRAEVLLALGRRAEALEIARARLPAAQEALRGAPLDAGARHEALSFLAMLGERKAVLGELEKLRQNPLVRSDVFLATAVNSLESKALALLGDRSAALRAISRSAREPTAGWVAGGSGSWHFDPAFASLWKDPEFLAIVNDPANVVPLPIDNRGIPKLSD